MFDKIMKITIDNKNNTKKGDKGKVKKCHSLSLDWKQKNQTGIQRLDGGVTAAMPHFSLQ